MDKYYLFAGDNYYPGGGMRDYIKIHFNSFEEALKIGAKYDWYQIMKIEKGELIIVAMSEN